MKKGQTKFVSVVVSMFIMLTGFVTMSFASEVKIVLQEELISFTQEEGTPFIDPQSGRTLVPMRRLFELLGSEIEWIAETRSVIATKANDRIIIQIDSDIATVNHTETALDQPAIIINDRTMVPLRFVAESFDLNVLFDGSTTTVSIHQKDAEGLTAGSYEIGKDLEPGNYYVKAEGDASLYFLKEPGIEIPSHIIKTVVYSNSCYITVPESGYIVAENATLYPTNAKPKVLSTANLPFGMYQVGSDIPEGAYRLTKNISGTNLTPSYLIVTAPYTADKELAVLSSHTIASTTTISVKNNQYLIVYGCSISAVVPPTTIATGGGGGGGGGGGNSVPKPTIPPKDEILYYDNFRDVPDFGVVYNVEWIDHWEAENGIFKYKGGHDDKVDAYTTLLKNKGFGLTTSTQGTRVFYKESTKTKVMVTYNSSVITVSILKNASPPGNGDDGEDTPPIHVPDVRPNKFYPHANSAIDFGATYGVEVLRETDNGNTITYLYPYTDSQSDHLFINYGNRMNDLGFSLYYQTNDEGIGEGVMVNSTGKNIVVVSRMEEDGVYHLKFVVNKTN